MAYFTSEEEEKKKSREGTGWEVDEIPPVFASFENSGRTAGGQGGAEGCGRQGASAISLACLLSYDHPMSSSPFSVLGEDSLSASLRIV